MDESTSTRRRFLASCGVALGAGVAGCNASPFGGGDDADTGPEGGRPDGGTGEVVDPLTPAGESSDQFDRFDDAGQERSGTYAEVYDRTSPSVGQIQVYTPSGSGSGTGWVFRDDYVVTNHHVVEGAEDISMRFSGGGWIDGTVVGSDIYSDLAVVSAPALPDSASGLPLRDSDPSVGAEVVAIGNPFGFSGSVSAGIVSGVDRALEGPNNFSIPDAIQTDAAVNPGNSGGPLVDLDGNVAGVINSGGGDNIGFAISASLTRRVVPSLIRDGEFRHSYMGVGIQDVGPLVAEANDIEQGNGVYVATVQRGAPADGALRGSTGQTTVNGRTVETGGDVIVALDDTPIPTNNALASFLALETDPGDTIDVTVLRNGRRRTVELTLGARENAR